MTNIKQLGRRFRAIRKSKGLRLKNIQEQTGLNPAVISTFERGLRIPHLNTLEKLIALFSDINEAVVSDPETIYLKARIVPQITFSENGCWTWMGACATSGYGIFRYGNKQCAVHRYMAYLFLGLDLNSDLYSLHKCDNRKCVNPAHLFIGTQQDNLDDYNQKNGYYPGTIATNKRKINIDDMAIIELYKKDYSIKQMANHFRCSRPVIYKTLKRLNLSYSGNLNSYQKRIIKHLRKFISMRDIADFVSMKYVETLYFHLDKNGTRKPHHPYLGVFK